MIIYTAGNTDTRPFQSFGTCMPVLTKHGITNKDSILLLHGGEDISPSIYNQVAIKQCGANNVPSMRDNTEIELSQKAVQMGIPIFGICRGAQLLCALAGGSLFQHVTGHQGGDHLIKANNGETYKVTSAHHQMMNPFAVDHEMIAWSDRQLSDKYHDESGVINSIKCEPEVVWFPKIKGFAVQGHPEWMKEYDEFLTFIRSEFVKRAFHV